MCQTLFFIPSQIGGWPVFGAGLLLAIWAVASVAALLWLTWRQGWVPDTWSYAILLLIIGGIIRFVLPAICKEQGLPIRGYGMMNLIAVVAGVGLAAWRAKRRGLDVEMIYSLAFWMLIPGIIGARAFFVIEYWPQYAGLYSSPNGGIGPLLGGIINIAEGGLVVYGAFFGAVAGVFYFVYKNRIPLLPLCDLIAPSMALGVGIGRIGCLMNGCCFGAVCDHGWTIQFPPEAPPYYAQVQRGQMYGFMLSGHEKVQPRVLAVRPDSPAEKAGVKVGDLLTGVNGLTVATTRDAWGAIEQAFYERMPLQLEAEGRPKLTIQAIDPLPKHSLPVYPTQLYSVIDGLSLCILLLIFARFQNRDGQVFALLLSTYPITRFYIESLRTDEAAIAGTGMSIAQNVSLLILLFAVGFWVYVMRRPKGLTWRKVA
jgi:phosphatidylglycerol:prolipoprotein diacylglycerol transferase